MAGYSRGVSGYTIGRLRASGIAFHRQSHCRRCILYEMHAPIRCTRMKRTLMRYMSCEIHISAFAVARMMERP
jgi:hypothetical protein